MKKLLIIIFLFLLSFGYSQNSTKKIKEEYLEITDLQGDKKKEFTEFNVNGEIIAEGSWEFETNKNYQKKYTSKIDTEQEKEYKYEFNKNKNIISKTQYFKEGKYLKHYVGYIQSYEILVYDIKNKLRKSTYYYATIDTLDDGREQINEDPKAYFSGIKNLDIEYITYDLKKTSIERFNEKGQKTSFLDLYNQTGIEYLYDDYGNVISYTKYYPRNNDSFSTWNRYNFDWESALFRDENIEGEYTVSYKFDEFGNWIEKKTVNGNYDFKNEIRHIVYF